ncbi:pilus assembly protein PilM, partial [Candidatus Kuenenbacteria bacterium]|nr:pilus assembly protein PilM [Candidatus Kuenenbacteria bacterium]
MDLFSKKSYLGVDLGTSAIKMVELQNKGGRAVLVTYGYVEQSTDIIRASSVEMENKIVAIIKSIYHNSRMNSKRVIAALPSFSVFSSIISLPRMNKKDLAQAVKWEAKKFIPLPIEEMTLDWKIASSQFELKKKLKQKAVEEEKAASQEINH